MIYGYCRISRPTQKIFRQIENIKNIYPNAIIIDEAYTGTKIEGREKWNKLHKKVKSGDKIVFDSVSRMSRNADDGVKLYMELLDRGIDLEFIKEPHINTSVYKEAVKGGIELTGTDVDEILKGINKYMIRLAEKQIRLAFEQAEKEVMDLRQRTKEGIAMARALDENKRIGTEPGRKLTTKKSIEAKEKIKKHAKDFGGSLTDKETMELCKIARNSYYKYKKELIEELENSSKC
ncbi:MAG: recombinase family protein [Clostridium sp.]|nr:recombinase family protein [Clostridium sp.]